MFTKLSKNLEMFFKFKKRFKVGQSIYVIENVLFTRPGEVKEINNDKVLVEIKYLTENYKKWFPIEYCFTKRQYDKYEKERRKEFEKSEKQRKIDERKIKKILNKFNTEEPLIKKLRTEK